MRIPVNPVRRLNSGLVKVVVKTDDLDAALLAEGSLANLAEMKARFASNLDGFAEGQDPGKIRVVLE